MTELNSLLIEKNEESLKSDSTLQNLLRLTKVTNKKNDTQTKNINPTHTNFMHNQCTEIHIRR